MIRCVAIDDEPIALSIIEEHCRRYGDIELECFTSPVAGMERVRQWLPDVVFLDIEMGSINGVSLARILPVGVNLVFTTAYEQYAIDGFEVDAADFLHKPVFYPRFEKAIAKVLARIRAATALAGGTIVLKMEYKNVVVDIGSISHIEAMDNYVKVYRRGLPMVLSQITMREIEALLPSDLFTRVHRSFIVADGAVEKFTNREVFIQGRVRPVPIGRKYLTEFNNKYKTQQFKDKAL